MLNKFVTPVYSFSISLMDFSILHGYKQEE
jgi:hypothetical protein